MTAAAITGLGAVSALGEGCAAMWEALAAGRDGFSRVRRFSTADFQVHLAATVPGRDAPVPRGASPWEAWLSADYAVAAAREAVAAAELERAGLAPHRIAVVLGTSLGHRHRGLHTLACEVARAIGAQGPQLTISTACTSSTTALGLGKELLDAGLADAAVVGGTDSITPEMFAGFHALGLLSAQKCAPFSSPAGTALGEGAGIVVLERAADAARRGAPVEGLLAGWALSADGYHATSPEPSGAGVARAMRAALADAGLEAERVDYVNAHATGTTTNDPAEWRAIETALGPRARAIPVSGSKSFLGHAQGAAGSLEAIVTLLCMRRGVVPPTLNFKGPRPRSPVDPVGEPRPRPHRVAAAVSSNSAFGGANTSLVLTAPAATSAAPPPRRPAYVLGAGALGPFGLGVAALREAAARGVRLDGRAASHTFEAEAPALDSRGLDRSGKLLTLAVLRALEEARALPRGPERARTGLWVGAQRISAETIAEHDAVVAERGLAKLSASAFTRLVLNAGAGACARLLGLQGPGTTLSSAHGSGLLALALAAHSLATRNDADVLVAAAVDELAAKDDPSRLAEGAACLVLGRAAPAGARLSLAGWAITGPGRMEEAAERALAMAGAREAPRWSPLAGVLPDAPAAAPLFEAALAVDALRRGEARRLLLLEPGGDSAACAVLLTCEESQGVSP